MTPVSTIPRKKKRSAALAGHPWLARPADLGISVPDLPDRFGRHDQPGDHLADRAGARDPIRRTRPLEADLSGAPCPRRGAGAGNGGDVHRHPVKEQFALQFYVGRPDGGERTIYVNPYTGRYPGREIDLRPAAAAARIPRLVAHPIHRQIQPGLVHRIGHVDPADGIADHRAVCLQEVLARVSRPRLRVRQGSRVFWGDFHRLAGLWSIPVHRHHERHSNVVPDRGVPA